MSPFDRDLHPAEEQLMRFFAYDHLPENLQRVSAPFLRTAIHIVNSAQPSAETTTALRKLLEAKDCAVRAALPPREG